jgi:hypothetical protein
VTEIRKRRQADDNHQVIEAVGNGRYMRQPCAQCPWRRDVPTGVFPAEAFRISASTAYDQAMEMFACHMSGVDRMSTCAGFLLSNAHHNLGVRFATLSGKIDLTQVESHVPLYGSYREMAEANGVEPRDPVLRHCRANGYGDRGSSNGRTRGFGPRNRGSTPRPRTSAK